MTAPSSDTMTPASRRSRPFVIGITGGIGSGKSTIARMLQERGAELLDADAIYRSLLWPGSPLSTAILSRFGRSVALPDGEIDRRALGEIVFRDPQALRDLDRLTHPVVVDEIRARLATTSASVVVVEAVKLVQSGLSRDVDTLWLVTADDKIRVGRLTDQRGLDPSAAARRIAAQEDLFPANLAPDVTIDNSGDLAETEAQVDAAWQQVAATLSQHRRIARRGAIPGG